MPSTANNKPYESKLQKFLTWLNLRSADTQDITDQVRNNYAEFMNSFNEKTGGLERINTALTALQKSAESNILGARVEEAPHTIFNRLVEGITKLAEIDRMPANVLSEEALAASESSATMRKGDDLVAALEKSYKQTTEATTPRTGPSAGGGSGRT